MKSLLEQSQDITNKVQGASNQDLIQCANVTVSGRKTAARQKYRYILAELK
jgi:hypothetical protein